jgi:hypothetical protein
VKPDTVELEAPGLKKRSRSCRTSEIDMQDAGLAEPQPVVGVKERRRIRFPR